MPQPDNVKALYNELKGTYDVGTEESFRQYLSDAKNREALRKELSSEYNTGDSAAWDKYLGYDGGALGMMRRGVDKFKNMAGNAKPVDPTPTGDNPISRAIRRSVQSTRSALQNAGGQNVSNDGGNDVYVPTDRQHSRQEQQQKQQQWEKKQQAARKEEYIFSKAFHRNFK